MKNKKIKVAISGLGNCASSLIQLIYFFRTTPTTETCGVMHYDIGGFTPADIEIVAAIDIDARKVGKDISHAIFAEPNCTYNICNKIHPLGIEVHMGQVLDGIAPHMIEYPKESTGFGTG